MRERSEKSWALEALFGNGIQISSTFSKELLQFFPLKWIPSFYPTKRKSLSPKNKAVKMIPHQSTNKRWSVRDKNFPTFMASNFCSKTFKKALECTATTTTPCHPLTFMDVLGTHLFISDCFPWFWRHNGMTIYLCTFCWARTSKLTANHKSRGIQEKILNLNFVSLKCLSIIFRITYYI